MTKSKKAIRRLTAEEIEAAAEMYQECKSLRVTAAAFGTDHKTISYRLKQIGVEVLSRTDAMKYSWKNHTPPMLGKKGELSPVYGRKMPQDQREKLRPTWEAKAESRLGRKRHSQGYWLVYSPENSHADRNGYVLEHRLIVEQSIGRELEPREIVHHINGNKTDNRLENLLLTNMAEHAKLHKLMGRNENA